MSNPIGSGICLAYGGTNARTAECQEGEISGFKIVETPTEPVDFFRDMATQILDAADEHFNWVVAGFPGPVNQSSGEIGPFSNISGMKHQTYDLREALVRAEPEVEEVLRSNKFSLYVVNDGELAAQAVASQFDRDKEFNKIAAIIEGTGLGSGVVERRTPDGLLRNLDLALEIGHIPIGQFISDTPEKRISGPALESIYGVKPEDLDTEEAWQKVGDILGRCSVTLGCMVEVDLVVPTGGVGMNKSHRFGNYLREVLDFFREHGDPVQKQRVPEVKFINPDDYLGGQTLEMFGAEGVVRDHSSRTSHGIATLL